MGRQETPIQDAIRRAVGRYPDRIVLWRNNVGRAEYVSASGAISRIVYGLCPGSSDLVGITCDGRFVALEVKAPGGRPTLDQIRFLTLVSRMGGIAGVVTSVEEALRLLGLPHE